jgi:Rha family phage regulatory protein
MENLVQIIDRQVVVSSRQVAEKFGKEHKHVLDSVREILKAENSAVRFFQENMYKVEGNNKSYPEYLMNRDGFTLLAMGFTGKEALQWKLKYIAAFNEMEELLKEQEVIPKDLPAALRMAAEIAEKAQALQIENTQQKQIINEMQPKASYYDLILQNNTLMSVTQIAKDYGMSAKKMNSLLHELGVQYKQGGIWFLYEKYQCDGYTQSKTFPTADGENRFHTYWTQKGRLFIYHLLKNQGVLPVIEQERNYG